MLRYSFLLLTLCSVALFSPLRAVDYGPGTAGHQFLKLGIGARPVAMGNAFTAIADDANALYWNPAGIRTIDRFTITAMKMLMFGEIDYNYGAVIIPLKKFGYYAADFMYLGATDVYRDENGIQGGTFENNDKAASFGMGFPITKRLSVGASARIIRSQLEIYRAWAATFDIGLLYQPYLWTFPWKFFHLGAVIKNMGSGIRFINNWDPPPLNLRGGIAGKFPIYRHRLILSSDIEMTFEKLPLFSFGGEFMFKFPQQENPVTQKSQTTNLSSISLRSGYQAGMFLGAQSGLTYGFGIEYDLHGFFIQIDAVQLTYGYLGVANRVSMSLRF